MFMDHDLARRLEPTEGQLAASFAEARAERSPEHGATWRDFGGTVAIFDGPDSPMTQTFGLGLAAAVDAAGLGELEAYFTSRGADVMQHSRTLKQV